MIKQNVFKIRLTKKNMASSERKSSKQNQTNLDESQRDVVRKKVKDYNPQLQNIKRIISKNSLRNGLIKQRRSLL